MPKEVIPQDSAKVEESAPKQRKKRIFSVSKEQRARNILRHKPTPKTRGPKPLWLKHLEKNDAIRVTEQYDAIATRSMIYKEAWDRGKLELCVEMRTEADNRLFGKPFTAINPAENNKAAPLTQDNRLQAAIQQLTVLNVSKDEAKRVFKAAKPMLEAAQVHDEQQLN